MKRNPYAALAAVVALAALFAAAPLAAGEADAVEHKQVFVKKFAHDCEGEDCADQKHERRIVIIDGDGEMREIEGDHTAWIGGEGLQAFAMAYHGKGGFLGVSTTELTPELRRHFGAPEEAGVLVAKVVDDSAAANAGVLVGDVLTAVGGESVASTGGLLRTVSKLEPGTAVDLELWRDGGLVTLGATLGERQPPGHHAFLMHCGDGEVDCPQIATIPDFDCDDDSDCRIEIECGEDGCDCTVNGTATECETLPGFAAPGE
jgi:C-terminal processing protease CtpA/Prc